MDEKAKDEFKKRLSEMFSGYRAEWLGPEVFRLFTKPSYFPQLTTAHPCFLVGGRGTGKTTALRCLSYQGQAELRPAEASTPDLTDLPFVGMYYRVNTNRVRAFGGPELRAESWLKLFAHYVNLEFSEMILRFLLWYHERWPSVAQIDTDCLTKFAISMHLAISKDIREVLENLELSRVRFEAMINNVAEEEVPPLSLQGAPIDQLLTGVKRLSHFRRTSFFFLLDEYENFDASQQRVVNTLIKHCGELYSFKVGVREFGDTERATLNDHEKLRHPADYKRIDITGELQDRFSDFAARVCSQRIKSVFDSESEIRWFLPELSPEDEAALLRVSDVVGPWVREMERTTDLTAGQRDWIRSAHHLETYTLFLRAEAEKKAPIDKIIDVLSDNRRWKHQYDNYKYAYLFAIRGRKSGIRKHYAGWSVYCQLASTNIRFLLELVDQAFSMHIESATDPSNPIPPQVQTEAAHATGQKNLRELEGLSLSGAKLTRFLLSLGRVFQVMAEDPVGHTPEVSQFHMSNDVSDEDHRDYAVTLLKEGITHLALLYYRGSKLQDPTDIRQFDYAIHPIFAPVFGFSYRRKRKIVLSDIDFPELVDRPTEAIAKLLRSQRREFSEDIPEQMKLFSEFYAKHPN